MSLNFRIRSLFSLISIHSRNEYLMGSSIRYLSDRNYNKLNKSKEENEEKESESKTRIRLLDQNGKILGIKFLSESKLLAQKQRMHLIKEKEVSDKCKYKSYKLVSNLYLAQINKYSEDINLNQSNENNCVVKDKSSSLPAKNLKEVKHLVFSTKLNENDLMTKINKTKQWLSRGHQIAINVNNPKDDRKLLDEIYNKFESELKGFAKFNQKKIKSNNILKFMIIPNFESKEQLINNTSDATNEDIDIENLDTNKLLSDEFENELNKK